MPKCLNTQMPKYPNAKYPNKYPNAQMPKCLNA